VKLRPRNVCSSSFSFFLTPTKSFLLKIKIKMENKASPVYVLVGENGLMPQQKTSIIVKAAAFILATTAISILVVFAVRGGSSQSSSAVKANWGVVATSTVPCATVGPIYGYTTGAAAPVTSTTIVASPTYDPVPHLG
jgi:hypothetical protein